MKNKDSRQLRNATGHLRAQICKWFGTDGPESVVLTPGILIALRVLLGSLKIRKLLLSTEEYYESRHFPGVEVCYSSPDKLTSTVDHQKPDVVLMSVVTWRGHPLDVRESFGKIASNRNGLRPLLVADYAHAGAVGFPEIASLCADITVGDLTKWVFPPAFGKNLAFLHVTEQALQASIEPIFRGFYLATTQSLENSARWLVPSDILEVQDWIKSTRRGDLLEQYERDRKLADKIAKLHETIFQSCIGWLPLTADTKRFKRKELLWTCKDGIRVMCRDLDSPKKRAPLALAKTLKKE